MHAAHRAEAEEKMHSNGDVMNQITTDQQQDLADTSSPEHVAKVSLRVQYVGQGSKASRSSWVMLSAWIVSKLVSSLKMELDRSGNAETEVC